MSNKLKRIILHWTAGSNNVSDTDKDHYHFIIDGNGKVHHGDLPPEANISTKDADGYMAHTLRANTGAIGVAVAGMAGARERPFNSGPYPLTERQMNAMYKFVADLADEYNIPVKMDTVLTHAEVEPTLGIKQRGKWDIMWLPGMRAPANPVAVGSDIRSSIRQAAQPAAEPSKPKNLEDVTIADAFGSPLFEEHVVEVISRRFGLEPRDA